MGGSNIFLFKNIIFSSFHVCEFFNFKLKALKTLIGMFAVEMKVEDQQSYSLSRC